jgi:hypothetical protein
MDTKKEVDYFGIIIDNKNNTDVTCYIDFKQQAKDIYFFLFFFV